RADVASVLLHPTERTLQAVLVEFDLPRWVPIADSVKPDFAALEKLGLGVPHIESRTLDDQTWIIGFAGDQASTKYYRWDRKQPRAEFLFSVKPELDSAPLVKMHPLVIRSRDGLELVSYLSLPLGADPKGTGTPNAPLPMVLLVHGGPWARDN